MIDTLSSEVIKSYCSATDFDIILLDEIDSTNKYLKSINSNSNIVVISNIQTNGKGRSDKTFFSPADSGIYLSLSFKPCFDIDALKFVTPFSAVVVNSSISDTLGLKTKIKWINDLYYNDKKVCGILTESVGNINTSIEKIIVGIGINVYKPDSEIPFEIKDKMGYLLNQRVDNLRNKLCAKIIDGFYTQNKIINKKNFIDTYKSENYLIGKNVVATPLNITGTVIGINDDCELLIQSENGEIFNISSGCIDVKQP